MISNNNDIGNTVNNVINRNTLPHINNINPALLKRAAAELLSQARNANGTLNNTPTEVSLSSPQDDNVTIPNTTTSITLEHDDHHPALLRKRRASYRVIIYTNHFKSCFHGF